MANNRLDTLRIFGSYSNLVWNLFEQAALLVYNLKWLIRKYVWNIESIYLAYLKADIYPLLAIIAVKWVN